VIAESLRIALRALTANKLRTALTMLGIVIGVAAVIALLAIGQGASAAVESRFAALGTNVIYIVPGQLNLGGVRSAAGSAPTLTLQDYQAIASSDAISAVAAVAPERSFFGQVIYQGLNTNTRITGTTPSYQDVLNFYPAQGEFFTDDDVQARAQVAVLGANVAQNLFGDMNPIGETIRVNAGGGSANLRVIGVMQPKGGTGFLNRDDQIFIPITTALSKLQRARTASGGEQINSIDIQARSDKDIPAAIDQVTQVLLANRHSPDDFQVRNVQDQIDAQKQASQTLTILLGAIAGISLVVGGIGIMNIMIVSVTERTREIGIRKAVGAKRRDILMQFLMEALVVSVIGGLIGILAGIGTSWFVEGKQLNGQEIQTVVVPSSILLAFGVSAAIGLFFGIYPASRAARLNPIEALRYE
jgi:putative ABC transport system permease protein